MAAAFKNAPKRTRKPTQFTVDALCTFIPFEHEEISESIFIPFILRMGNPTRSGSRRGLGVHEFATMIERVCVLSRETLVKCVFHCMASARGTTGDLLCDLKHLRFWKPFAAKSGFDNRVLLHEVETFCASRRNAGDRLPTQFNLDEFNLIIDRSEQVVHPLLFMQERLRDVFFGRKFWEYACARVLDQRLEDHFAFDLSGTIPVPFKVTPDGATGDDDVTGIEGGVHRKQSTPYETPTSTARTSVATGTVVSSAWNPADQDVGTARTVTYSDRDTGSISTLRTHKSGAGLSTTRMSSARTSTARVRDVDVEVTDLTHHAVFDADPPFTSPSATTSKSSISGHSTPSLKLGASTSTTVAPSYMPATGTPTPPKSAYMPGGYAYSSPGSFSSHSTYSPPTYSGQAYAPAYHASAPAPAPAPAAGYGPPGGQFPGFSPPPPMRAGYNTLPGAPYFTPPPIRRGVRSMGAIPRHISHPPPPMRAQSFHPRKPGGPRMAPNPATLRSFGSDWK